MQLCELTDWEEAGNGLSRKVVQGLIGGLAPRGGTAVVLNAKGGREVSVFSKAGTKVLAAYSESKASFPGQLTDSRTGKVIGAKVKETPGLESRKLVQQALVEARTEKGSALVEEATPMAEPPLASQQEAHVGKGAVGELQETEAEGGKKVTRDEEAEGEVPPEEALAEWELPVLGTWDEEDEVPFDVEKGLVEEEETGVQRQKKQRKPLPESCDGWPA